jgi:peptidoglycan/LPS O-acetylase OafA/YrhL
VLPVILFHGGFSFFSGGFVGVDVFFVISGYLITTIILNEIEAGIFTILGFYERRARRILPALFVVMLACLPFAWRWMYPDQLIDFSKSLVAVSTFSSNILFWLESGYFAPAAELKPMLHTWSLAVEEQYYLLFPLFMLFAWRFGKRFIVVALGLIVIASLSFAQWQSANDPVANFYLLPTRIWELLLGSLCAFYLLKGKNEGKTSLDLPNTTAQALSATGLVLIVFSIVFFNDQTPFPGLYALLPTVGTAFIIIFASNKTFTGVFLSHRLLVGIGLISYSAYLWHHPLFAFARIRSLYEPGSQLMLLLGAVSLVLAYLTWKYIENPFRNKQAVSRTSIFRGAVLISFGLIGLGVFGVLGNGFENRATPDGVSFKAMNITERIRINPGLNNACEGSFTLSELCRTDDEPEVLIWGDSYAMHLIQGILSSKPDAKIIQMTRSECAPIMGVASKLKLHPVNYIRDCIEFNNEVIKWLKQNRSIRYAVLASPFSFHLVEGALVLTEDGALAEDQGLVLQKLGETMEMLQGLGIKPVMFAMPPRDGSNLGQCLVKSTWLGLDDEVCDFEVGIFEEKYGHVLEFMRQVDETYNVIWPSDTLCDDRCRTRLDGKWVYRDGAHYSHEGSAQLGLEMDFYGLITRDQ